MFHHIVLMRLDNVDQTFLARVRGYEQRIRAELPFVRSYHFGSNRASRSQGLTWAVVSVFDTASDHDRYQASDVHQEMKAFMSPHIADIVACDFDSEETPAP